MNVTLAVSAHAGVIEALSTSPWYFQLLVAGILGMISFGLKWLDSHHHIDSGFLDMVIFVLAFAAFLLVFQGVFGNS